MVKYSFTTGPEPIDAAGSKHNSAEPTARQTPLTITPTPSAEPPPTREPDTLALFRALPKRAQHQFLQLAIDAMELYGPAERAADTFLAISAWEIESGDQDRAEELYPQGCPHSATWTQHNAGCARDLIHYERSIIGRVAMLTPFVRISDTQIVL
jgi:hypothetical protein